MTAAKKPILTLCSFVISIAPLFGQAQSIGGIQDVRVTNPVTTVTVKGKVNVGTIDKMTSIQALIGGYGEDRYQYILSNPSPSITAIKNIGSTSSTAWLVLPETILSQGTTLIQFLLTKPKKKNAYGLSPNDNISRFAYCIPGSDTWTSSTVSKFVDKDGNATDPCAKTNFYDETSKILSGSADYPMNAAFSADTLLSPLVYKNTREQTDSSGKKVTVSQPVLDYLTYISGLTTPLPLPPVLTQDSGKVDAKTVENDQDVRKTLIKIRTLAAGYSLGLYVLQQIYAERLPTIANKTSGGNELIPDAGDSVSPLQVEDYMATRRINDSVWRASIETADPVKVQRELLYVNSEQLYETYKLRRTIEQMSAILAATQLGFMSATKDKIEAEQTTGDTQQEDQTITPNTD